MVRVVVNRSRQLRSQLLADFSKYLILGQQLTENPTCRVFAPLRYKIMGFMGCCNVLPVDKPVRKLSVKSGTGA